MWFYRSIQLFSTQILNKASNHLIMGNIFFSLNKIKIKTVKNFRTNSFTYPNQFNIVSLIHNYHKISEPIMYTDIVNINRSSILDCKQFDNGLLETVFHQNNVQLIYLYSVCFNITQAFDADLIGEDIRFIRLVITYTATASKLKLVCFRNYLFSVTMMHITILFYI